MPRLALVLALGLAAAPSVLAQLPAEERLAAQERMLEIARSYAEHEWTATEDNVFHGEDAQGVRVDTADVGFHEDGFLADGSVNKGVPYQWGGFVTLEEFDAAIAAGRWAGHLPGDAALRGSAQAVGVDCSGFVSQCWELPVKHSTRSLGALCVELDGWDALQPGDLINKYDQHAMLFVDYADAARTKIRVLEATLPRVLENVYTSEKLAAVGFLPMRYQPLTDGWDPLVLDAAAFRLADPTAQGTWVEPPVPLENAEFAPPWDAVTRGDWVRYRISQLSMAPSLDVELAVAGRTDDGLVLQSSLSGDGRRQQTAEVVGHEPSWAEQVLALLLGGQDPLRTEVVERRVAAGRYEVGGRAFDAHKVDVVVEGAYQIRGTECPARFTLAAVHTNEVPLVGVLDVVVTTEFTMEGATTTSVTRRTAQAFLRN